MLRFYFLLLLFFGVFFSRAQVKQPIKILNDKTSEPVEAVSIAVSGKPVQLSDKQGIAVLFLTKGNIRLLLTAVGFEKLDTLLDIPATDTVLLRLIPLVTELAEVVFVSSTRNNQKIESSPLKVEVLGREDMEEESTIKPAGIASILGDVSGVQIQQSSAITGNANVRIQGLDGRYTQILKDGLPLYDGFSGGFGILSIPPLDLRQVELIKGSASTLYGGGAIGGLVNIISRRPATAQEAVLSINQTTLKETNVNSYASRRFRKTGYTFFGGYNIQKAVDVNNDGFSDLAKLNGLVLHPRFFFYPDNKSTIILGYTGTFEKRNGGDMLVLAGKPDPVHRYFEKNSIYRNSFEFSWQNRLSASAKIEFKNSLSSFKRVIENTDIIFTGRQKNYYSELSVLISKHKMNTVAGINVTGDQFEKLSQNIPLPNFRNNTIGIFIQNTWIVKEKTTIEAGLRDDYHLTYGNFFLPRVAFFHRLDEHWAARAGVGFGYKTPNALTPQNTDFAIQNILGLESSIQAEKSVGYNAEINYKFSWGESNELFINQAFFLTKLMHPVVATLSNSGTVSFQNEDKPVLARGSDTYIRTVISGWELYAGYTFTLAEKKYLKMNQFIPLTPRNRFAFTLVRDFEKEGFRFGIEGSYNGAQFREDYSKTPGYFFMAAMIEKKWGNHFSTVLNGENLFDYRQSRIEALYTGPVYSPVFKPLWAPIDGRVINFSIRWKL